MLIDTHCHIQFKAYDDDREAVISRCKEKGMVLNIVGTQKTTSELAVELAEKYDWMYASIGLHPIQEYKTKVVEETTEFMARGEMFDEDFYNELAKHPKVIGIGETGLDRFHVPKDIHLDEVMETQRQTFLAHYRVAQKNNLPLVIHVRDAHEDMINLLATLPEAQAGTLRATIHCFSGNWEYAKKYIAFGCYLGFTGIVTYPPKKTDPKPQEQLNEVVAKIPLDRIVVETDAPYLAPHVIRGTKNEPMYVEEVVKHIARVRSVSVEELEHTIETNTRRLFSKIS